MSQRVALVIMPFAAEDGPALGASLLASGLRGRGIPCDLFYLNLEFAARLGLRTYRAVDELTPFLPGEWAFAPSAFPEGLPDAENYFRECLTGGPIPSTELIRARGLASGFVEHCRRAISWENYDVVGFSSSFQQNLASLALARLIKADHPEIRIVLGGANLEGPMGAAILDLCDFVDAVCDGEGDQAFPEYVLSDERTRRVIRGGPVTDLDALPAPDFSDYFAALKSSGLDLPPAKTHLKIELGRGCWWGEKAACTFCGLNGQGRTFRRKSTPRFLEEWGRLSRYPTRSVILTDNILDQAAYDEVLPRMSSRGGLRLFCEVKPPLSGERMEALAKAGVRRIQPGIESLSTRALGRMRKGTRSIDNLALLLRAIEQQISVTWNLLCGFPGETEAELLDQLELISLITHLLPPTGLYPVQFHRFAALTEEPERHGVGPLEPVPAYRHLYPFDAARLRELAYFFTPTAPRPVWPVVDRLAAAVTEWRMIASGGHALLIHHDDGERLEILDTRPIASARRVTLSGPERELLLNCREPLGDLSQSATLTALKDKRLVIERDGAVLALSLPSEAFSADPDEALVIAEQFHRGRLRSLCAG